jgi:hypothetical protein
VQHGHHEFYDRIPEQKEIEIYDPQEFVDQMIAGTMTTDVAAAKALERVRAKADQLQKPSLLTNPTANNFRAGSSSRSLPVTGPNEPNMSEHVRDDWMHVEGHLGDGFRVQQYRCKLGGRCESG